MTQISQQAPTRLREMSDDDLLDFTEAINLSFPDQPVTLEQMQHWERSYPQGNPRLRLVATDAAGRAVAFGTCLKPFWMRAAGVYEINVLVTPGFRNQGMGSALLAALEPFGWEQGADRLWSMSREDHAESLAFAARHGYGRIGIRFESEIDLGSFDEATYAHIFERVEAAGYRISTFAEESDGSREAERRLYELDHAVMQEVPFPGGAVAEMSFDTWRSENLEGPAADPAAIFIAVKEGEWVGLTTLILPKDAPAITGSTGVARAHRRQGLALALKVESFRLLKRRGYKAARTQNDTANPPILRLNERLGYRRLPGWIAWEKPRN